MKSIDEEREKRLRLLTAVEEEILSFVFNLDRKDLFRALDPGDEFEKISKKISKKTPYNEKIISEIIMTALIKYIHGSGTEEERKKKSRRALRYYMKLVSGMPPQKTVKTWFTRLLSRLH
jgi:hypothetical protein